MNALLKYVYLILHFTTLNESYVQIGCNFMCIPETFNYHCCCFVNLIEGHVLLLNLGCSKLM